ncbi:conserved protein of unknown function [Candidatus Hydrogenisulfobacillus filiaventi]|uniref:Glycosyltransferase family 1 protein n=1 Tax=Candidatus Hydrogenisulfobacillus filiaventi TaxID=2707344 RepID=A0A6F8ZCD9_9FIRM|nr:conserved protein of unknown function [Candidatus Hydrogenisulfobacillus filiaventi]
MAAHLHPNSAAAGGRLPVVAVDARYGLRAIRRGIGEYVYRLMEALAPLPKPYQLVLFGDGSADPGVVRYFRQWYPVHILRAPNFLLWEQLVWPRALRALPGLALVHGTANIGPWGRWPLVLTVHDVIEWHRGRDFPGHLTLRHRLSRTYRMGTLAVQARRARLVLTVSQHARTDIGRVLRVPERRIRVAPLGSKWADGGLGWAGDRESRPYLLALGAVDPRKNLEGLLRAAAAVRVPDFRLEVVGVEPGGLTAVRTRVAALGLEKRVAVEGMVKDAVLRERVRRARGFVYPSYYEGFGLPVLDAMILGVPVVASRTTAVGELGGSAVLGFNPADPEEMARALTRLWEDAALRAALSAAGRARAQTFSWARTAAATHAAYLEVLGLVAGP